MNTIEIEELQDGFLLFLNGKSTLAKGIKVCQKLRFFKTFLKLFTKERAELLVKLNHVGFLINTKDNQWLTFEQDHPGRFQASDFNLEYITEKKDIYIGVPKKELTREQLSSLRVEARKLAGEDTLLNYSYKSYLGFIFDTLSYKLIKRNSWITGKPKGSTCSQITGKLYQTNCDMIVKIHGKVKKWWKLYPCEIASSNEIELRKLVY